MGRVLLISFLFCLLGATQGDSGHTPDEAEAKATSKPETSTKDVVTKKSRKAHSLFAWGRNNAGQLGLGHLNEVKTPEIVSTFAAKEMRRVAAGGANENSELDGFSLVISSSGHLFTFGCNTHGQLGVGDKVDRSSMVPVNFLVNGKVTQVAAGAAFAVAVTGEGQVYSWGANDEGQLGHGDLRERVQPELVAGQLSKEEVVAVSTGIAHALVMTKEGSIFTWGSNTRGQLGIGKQVVRQTTPVHIQGAITGIKFVWVATGGFHTLAASRSGEVYCWGSNDYGQLGLGDLEERPTPHAILHKFTRSKITRVAAGGRHSVALTEQGDIFTWGSNDCGQLGYDNKGGRKYVGYPKRIETIRGSRIKAGHSMSLAVLPSGKVFIWGCNRNGELGLGDVASRSAPHILPAPSNIPFSDICPGANHVLANNKKGELFAWGKNVHGQLGLAFNTHSELKPTLVSSVSSTDVVSVVTGGYAYEYQGHTMALTAAGKLFTWGWNAFGQLGLGTIDMGSPTPTRLFALEQPYDVVHMAVGQYNSMVAAQKKGSTHVFTWGPNYNGQLGHKFMELGPILQPSKVEALKGKKIIMMSMGYSHMMVLTDDGVVYTWGNNAHGQLGTGDGKERTKPTPVSVFRASKVKIVACSQQSSFAVNEAGVTFAWGYNENFELGLGEGTNRNSPQIVKGMAGMNITMLIAGGYHTIAVTDEGDLYTWGGNQYGQLGHGNRQVYKEPQKVEGLPQILQPQQSSKVQALPPVAAGTWHSCAVTVDKEVYTWGRGNFGQLGHADLKDGSDQTSPRKVDAMTGSAVAGVVAAASHTMVTAVPSTHWGM
ncbi:hypothetical protein CYMTET_47552 [Cymbomonas tetramitiformis]|uniref:RCC1-like domain-containing protein n=1 Tax=Cymbomonas tetramitiformis TaxID=36881 RepID=A0AAE0EVV7_9CHLO|nr:hypothetical protein CYMTET_47552 [Cymbomonas tetramitiformis]